MFLAQAGFQALDGDFLRNAMIFLAAVAVFALCIKQLFFTKGVAMAQPLIVALEKEFVTKGEYDKRHTEVRQELKEVRAYVHQEVHGLREVVNASAVHTKNNSEMLFALDERTKTQGRSIDQINIKMDRLGDRIADKVEKLIEARTQGGGQR